VRASGVDCDFGHALACLKDIEDQADPAGAFRPASEQPPWVDGEMAAAVLRRETGITHGPLRNRMLSELLQTHPNTFRQTRTIGSSRPYGLRIGSDDGSGRQRLTLQTHSSGSRRFEAARALGDAQWSRRTDASRLGPIGWADTARQRFQRTFAQALLCPYADLDDDLGPGYVDDDRIDAAARHYHVTEGVIRTVLVNKGRIDRDRLPASS
jgi:hypothetical protein